ncbi:Plancitoxin-1, partial [Trichinella sp. T8]
MSFIFYKQHQNAKMQGELVMAILYKAPAQSNGRILVEGAAANWAGSPGAVTADNGHSFAKALEHVIAVNANNKFISYNNYPPDVPKVKTKSNSKGVLMMDITGPDAAAWIVHTVPGFPKARTGYLFPPAEVQKGHLLICLTIKEDQIDTIALTLRFATPLIYYNDIPDTEMNSRPNLKKLVSGESRVLPPLAVTKDTTTAAAVGLKVTIYSKGEKSRYAMALRIATPLIYHNDIPDDPARPNLKKLVNGESRLTPPLTVAQQISTAAAQGLKMTIYSKSEKSKYEIYRRVLVKKLKTGIKVWTTRDKTLKSDCRILGRNIKLIASPIDVNGDASSLDSDASQWLISDPGNKFCVIDKPYHKSQTKEPAMAVCIDDAAIFGHFNRIGQNYLINCVRRILILWAYFPSISQATSKCQNAGGAAPAQSNGRILVEGAAANWAGSPGAVTADNGHSFAKALEHVIAVNANNKFISYNNHPPDVPKVKTKSNSKGVLMMDTTNADAAAWIVHTVPGFPKARTGYLFPPAEVQKGHLLICLTIKEDQIDTIALTLRFATPLIYYNDIPDTEINSRPNLKKLVSGESRILPPLAVTKDTATAAAVGLKVTIYSKGEKSRYEIYRKILLKKLKSTVKVWTARDNKLKSDCRIPGRNIRLVTSPISVNGDQSTLENDVSQWLVTETGNKFCAVDKPYQKSQAMEPAMAVCIDDATISTRFREIAQNVENCS